MIASNVRPISIDFGLPAGVAGCLQSGVASAASGAGVGTAVTPGVGTAVGAGAGFVLGCTIGALSTPSVPPNYQGYFDYGAALRGPSPDANLGGAFGRTGGGAGIWIATGVGVLAVLGLLVASRRRAA